MASTESMMYDNNFIENLSYDNNIKNNSIYKEYFSKITKQKYIEIVYRIICILNDYKKLNKKYVESEVEHKPVYPNNDEFTTLCELLELPQRRNHVSYENKLSSLFDKLNINQKICILENILDENFVEGESLESEDYYYFDNDKLLKKDYIKENYLIHDYYTDEENINDFAIFIFSKLGHNKGNFLNINDMINENIFIKNNQVKKILDIIIDDSHEKNNSENLTKQFYILNCFTNKQLEFLGI